MSDRIFLQEMIDGGGSITDGGVPITDGAVPITETPSIKLDRILKRYENKIPDISSNESIFLKYITTASSDYQKQIFVRALDVLYLDDYIADLFIFIKDNLLNLSFENIELFLDNRKKIKLLSLKSDIANRDYKQYGNLYMFFYKSILENPIVTDFKIETIENFNYRSFLVTPKIDYIKSDSYKSYSIAEKDYWNIVTEYKDSLTIPTLIYKVAKNIYDLLFDKTYNNSIYGEPLLLKKDLSKTSFSNSREDNLDIIKTLLQDYKTIYRDYFLNQLDIMYQEMLDYKIENNFE